MVVEPAMQSRTRIVSARALAFLAFLAFAPVSGAEPAPPAHPDLAIRLVRVSGKTTYPGVPIEVKAMLVNVGKRSHPVVLPGDGSESAWREPHVYFTATRRADDGTWKEVASHPILRCGLYDRDWSDEIRILEPGKRVEITTWLPQIQNSLNLQEPGDYRVRLHYVYRAGASSKGGQKTEVPEAMRDVAPFSVESTSGIIVEVTPRPQSTPKRTP
ncbi:MAG: hypothetical protein ACI9MR_005159 [Myxococcota bacterium]|jgi:hypothetical protein